MRSRFINGILLVIFFGMFTCCYGQTKVILLPLDALTSFFKTNNNTRLDTIFIKDGNYKNIRVQIRYLSKNKVVITPQNKGEVLITGNSGFLIEESENIHFEGFVYRNTVGNIFRINGSSGVGIGNSYFLSCGNNPQSALIRLAEGASNNKIYNNTFDDNRAAGIWVINNDKYRQEGLCQNNVIRNNIFCNVKGVKEIYPNSNGNGMEAVQVGQMTSVQAISQSLGTIIENNRFEQFIGDQVEVISVKSSSNKITNNDFVDCPGGVSIRSGNNCLIINNEFLRVGRAIRLYGSGHRIENNTLHDVKVGIMIPSADFRTGETLKTKDGYHMAKDYIIEGNVIINPIDKAILTGSTDKKILPESLRFKNNRVLISDIGTKEKIVSILTKENNIASFNVENFVGKPSDDGSLLSKLGSRSESEAGPNWKFK